MAISNTLIENSVEARSRLLMWQLVVVTAEPPLAHCCAVVVIKHFIVFINWLVFREVPVIVMCNLNMYCCCTTCIV